MGLCTQLLLMVWEQVLGVCRARGEEAVPPCLKDPGFGLAWVPGEG